MANKLTHSGTRVESAWVNTNGGIDFPFGDFWRIALVNPIIMSIVSQRDKQLIDQEDIPKQLTAAKLNLKKIEDNRKSHSKKIGKIEKKLTEEKIKKLQEKIEELEEKERKLSLGFISIAGECLYKALGEQRQEILKDKTINAQSLNEWHRNRIHTTKLKHSIRILDLGCGEGYLGRILSQIGANYVGVDCSEFYLQKARARQEDLEARGLVEILPHFYKADLNGKMDAEILDNIINTHDAPNLTVLVVILEHLAQPRELLDWLGRSLRKSPDGESLAILVTLNMDYFSGEPRFKKENDVINGAEIAIHVNTKIDSADVEVDAHIRSHQLLKRLLRDSGLRILQYTPLRFSWDFNNEHIPAARRGIPTFDCYLISAYPDGERPSSEEWNWLQSHFKQIMTKREFEVFEKNRQHYKTIRLEPNKVIMERNNLGGNLYVVLDGSLELQDSSGMIPFAWRGDIAGELECADIGKEYEYLYSVSAGEDGARVLSIPAKQARELLKIRALAGSLLAQLRSRVLVRNLRTLEIRDHDSGISLGFSFDGAIPSHNIFAKTCRVILAAAEEERQTFKRDREGRRVFLSIADIKDRGQLKPNDDSQIATILRLFTLMGILDCMPGAQINATFGSYLTKAGAAIITESINMILEPNYKQDETKMEKLRTTILENPHVLGACPPRTGKKFKADSKIIIKQLYYIADNQNDKKFSGLDVGDGYRNVWKKSVERWYEYLFRLNTCFMSTQPMFFLLHDRQALHKFVTEEGKTLKNVIENYQLALFSKRLPNIVTDQEEHKIPTWDHVSSYLGAHEKARYIYYIDEFKNFILNDLNYNSGRLNYSGIPWGIEHYEPIVPIQELLK